VSGLVGLPGLEAVERQLEDVIVVLRAQQQRRMAGSVIRRPAWKNLVFTGAPGSGRSRAAAAVGRVYKELGLLSAGRLDEVSAIDLVGATRAETSALMADAAKRSTGSVLMINDAHAWHRLPDYGRHVLWELYKKLTEYRSELRDELAVILAGQAGPLRQLLYTAPPLAARFPATINFPGYTPAQLAAIFATLADEAGLSLAPEAERDAAALLAQAEAVRAYGNARLAVRLLNQVAAAQARRVAASTAAPHPATLTTVIEADIPEHLERDDPPPDEGLSGQYL
jgi:AAA lid domain/ATPase family associated with various cellular activities (AAA)